MKVIISMKAEIMKIEFGFSLKLIPNVRIFAPAQITTKIGNKIYLQAINDVVDINLLVLQKIFNKSKE